MKPIVRFAAVVGILALAALAYAQTNPFLGTWKLNLAKSKYNAGQPPKSGTIVNVSAGRSTKVTANVVLEDGTTRMISYTSNFDGNDVPVTGSPDYDTIAATRNGNTIDGVRKKRGRVVQTYKGTVSADGKTLTLTATGTTAAGQKIDSTQVFDKQ